MGRLLTLISYLNLALLVPSAVWASDAPKVYSNPQGAQYIANISSNGIVAQIIAQTPLNGIGVNFNININGNASLGSANFLYHIHDFPVPEDGNCNGTKAHLDPYGAGETTPCNSNNPASCQVGDLSGKHGNILSLPGFSTNYTDNYVSLTPGSAAFMGNRSFVLHYLNKTRIACANFQLVAKLGPGNNISYPGAPSSNNSYVAVTSTFGGPITTASAITSVVGAKPSGNAVPQSAAAKAHAADVNHGIVLGPLIFGIAAVVW